jgi:hypothetical protein
VATDVISVSYAVTSRGGYSDGAVWINTNASNTNTQNYVDGIPENPVSTIAAAITIATALNLRRYRVTNGSSITLAASHTNRTMLGHGYTLALGGQDVSGSYFEGVEGLSGTATCPTAESVIIDCHLNVVTIGEADFVRCHLMNTVTLSQASVPYRFHDCTGITSAKITFAGASQAAVISKVSGVLTIAGMVSTNTLYLDGNADVTFDNTNNTGTVYIAGSIRLTNNGVSMSITDTARWSEDQSVAAVSGAVTLANGAHGGAGASLNLGAGATISKADGHALTLTGGTNGHGLLASGAGTGSGIAASGGSTSGSGIYAVGDADGQGILAIGGDSALGLTAGLYLKSNSSGTPVGLYVEDGAIITDDAGTALLVSSTGGDGNGVTLVGNGTGGDLVADITGNLSGSVNSVTTEVTADMVKISGDGTAADRLEAVLDATPTGLVVDDNDPDPLATAFETNLTEATNDHYNGAFLVFSSGALLGQSRKISDYDGTSKVVTVTVAFTEAPAGGDAFLIVGRSE